MPNWCWNHLTISGLTEDQAEEIREAVQEGKLLGRYCPEPDWSSIPDANGNLPVDGRFPDGSYDERWYSWRVANWGCKWDITSASFSDEHDPLILIFDTPWSDPGDGIAKMSKAFPEATFKLFYCELGCDFLGLSVYRNGLSQNFQDDASEYVERMKEDWITENREHLNQLAGDGDPNDQEWLDEQFYDSESIEYLLLGRFEDKADDLLEDLDELIAEDLEQAQA